MNRIGDIKALIEPRKNNILLGAEMAMPESQFKAFRKFFLDELGNNGFYADLERLLESSSNNTTRHGTGRPILRKKGGVP